LVPKACVQEVAFGSQALLLMTVMKVSPAASA